MKYSVASISWFADEDGINYEFEDVSDDNENKDDDIFNVGDGGGDDGKYCTSSVSDVSGW